MEGPGGPTRPTVGWFCGTVCSFVRFSPDHAAITAELTAHLEDHRDALLERDPALSPDKAEEQAVRAMGDPEQLGRALNESHSPLLGWFQIWFRRAVWGLAVLVLLVTLPRAGELVTSLAAPADYNGHMLHLMEHYEEYDVVADFVPDPVWHYKGYTFSIQRAVVIRADGGDSLTLHYVLKASHPDPWQRQPVLWDWLRAEDDLGNQYPPRGQQGLYLVPTSGRDSSGSLTAAYPFVSYYGMWVTGIDPEASSITLRYDRYGENAIYLTLPLKGGT